MSKLPQKDISLLDGVSVYALAIGTNLVVQFVFAVIIELSGLAGDYVQLAFMVIAQLAWLASTVVYFIVRKFRPRLSYPIENARPSTALSVVLPVLSIAGFYLCSYFFQYFLDSIGYNFSAGVNVDTPGKMVFGIIGMVILAPFCEELIFRGVLFGGLSKKLNPYIAALLSAVAFSFMHMNPEQTVYQFILGFACAIAAYKSGSIVSGMVLHSGSNLIAILLGLDGVEKAFVKVVQALTRTPAVSAVSTILLAIGCGAAIFGICVAMKKLNDRVTRPKSSDRLESTENEKADVVMSAPKDEGKHTLIAFVIYGVTVGVCVISWITAFVVAMMGA